MKIIRLALVVLALTLVVNAARADTQLQGQTPSGAYYAISVPDGWNGDLVIWNHGFTLSPFDPGDDEIDIGPLADVFALEGTAVAASSYSLIGWAVFQTDRDLEEMMQVFNSNFEAPDRIYLTGASLGGAVIASALERANLGNVVGALSICGAVAGARNWDGALDYRLLYDAVCADIPAAAIPGGAKGLPKNSTISQGQVRAAVNACTGVDERKRDRTRAQKKNMRKIAKVSKLPKTFLQTDMGYVTFGMGDMVHDRKKLRGKIGTGNRNVDYGDQKINDEIARVSARKGAAKRLKNNFTPTGVFGDVKFVAIHTDKDGLVIVENMSEYAKVVPPEKLTVAVVKEKIPSHCAFEPAEVLAAWQSLRDWVDGGPQPTPLDIQGTCNSLQGLVGGKCRFAPDFRLGEFDNRIRPRNPR